MLFKAQPTRFEKRGSLTIISMLKIHAVGMWEIVGGVVRHHDIVVKIKITNFFLVCLLVIREKFLLYGMWYMYR